MAFSALFLSPASPSPNSPHHTFRTLNPTPRLLHPLLLLLLLLVVLRRGRILRPQELLDGADLGDRGGARGRDPRALPGVDLRGDAPRRALGGAKRASPVMCVAACELLGAPRAAAFPTAAALEMAHAASLVHDDLPCMDAAPLRRGRPSTPASSASAPPCSPATPSSPSASPTSSPAPARARPPPPSSASSRDRPRRGLHGMAAGQFLDLSGAAAGGEAEVLLVLEKKFGEMAECSACAAASSAAPTRTTPRRCGATASRIDRALEIVEELKDKAKSELRRFDDKCGRECSLFIASWITQSIGATDHLRLCSMDPLHLGGVYSHATSNIYERGKMLDLSGIQQWSPNVRIQP
uniref:Uncharacterized protein n=1 Tax=Ananas comosus var. bracteatus TaxID=296719 RepID=A0A6V7PWD7_ANACO|nr:unnamed protein product [Ananas comosus var. bracteatus]